MSELSIIQLLSEKDEPFLDKTKLSKNYAEPYNKFGKDYHEKRDNEIESIIKGFLILYAIDSIAEFKDYSEEFEQIEYAISAFKSICERPKSHLKSINEVRPIETIKRIGYEAIPYLSAHSEDWLVRTASGLKPKRLFSRVEEDDFQIYENRVVKTLLDLLISFLSRLERELRDDEEQLSIIMNNSVQTGSFGFDKNFKRAIKELIADYNSNEEALEKFIKLEEKGGQLKKLHPKSLKLLKKYRTLRDTKLYSLLKNAKSVQNPLNETNILLMDKHYSVIYKLWKKLHRIPVATSVKKEDEIEEDSLSCFYQQFVATLCGYATYRLNFKILKDGRYKRDDDNIEVLIEKLDNGIIRVSLSDQEKIPVLIEKESFLNLDTSSTRFEYDGKTLRFPNDITDDEIKKFCSQLKTPGFVKKRKDKYKEQQNFLDLKNLIEDAKASKQILKTSFIIIPYFIELSLETISLFYDSVKDIVKEYFDEKEDNEVIIALPLCNEYEQKVIKYAQDDNSNISILPITMFDINSFRRIQNVLYRHILKFKKGRCLVCGGKLHKDDNKEICYKCNNLTLIKTQCPKCGEKYDYLNHYDITEDTLKKMQEVQDEQDEKKINFIQRDSLWRYKNIVPMRVENGKIRPICPYCHYFEK